MRGGTVNWLDRSGFGLLSPALLVLLGVFGKESAPGALLRVPGGRIEIASFEPELGPIFYFQRKLDDTSSRLFERTRSCLGCHAGDATNFLPGPLGRSIYPDRTGRSMKNVRGYRRSGHQIPMELRWGGWFVSGRHGEMRHMGNALAEQAGGEVTIDLIKVSVPVAPRSGTA